MSAAKKLERRREPRFPLQIPIEITSSEKRRLGMSRNACSAGILVASQGQFEAGEPVLVLFRVRRDGKMRQVNGRVVRCFRDPNPELFPHLVAIRLERPTPELLSAEAGAPRT